MDSGVDSTFLLQKIGFSWVFYLVHTKNIEGLADHGIFNDYSEAQYIQLIVPYIYQLLLYSYYTIIWKFTIPYQYTEIILNRTNNHNF